jgi:hypothetical protein
MEIFSQNGFSLFTLQGFMFCVDITLIAKHFNYVSEATTFFLLQEVIFILDFRDKQLYIVRDCV